MDTPLIQDGFDVRHMTAEEHQEYLRLCEELSAVEQRQADALAKKKSAHVKLAALGLTEEEIAALIG
jgi:hypothetical protein